MPQHCISKTTRLTDQLADLCIVALDLLAVKLVIVQLLVSSHRRPKTRKYDACSPKTFQILKLGAGIVVTKQ